MSQANTNDNIKHVVVLMLENRSFDQMLGGKGVNGTPLHTQSLHGGSYPQSPTATNIVWPDPKHDYPNVKLQVDDPNGFVLDYWCEYEKKKGLGYFGIGKDKLPLGGVHAIMDYFPHGHLVAKHALAEKFTVCDNWFSSVPGPTWPNRFFVHSGTSNGYVCMPHGLFFSTFALVQPADGLSAS